jgi:hypothetical protein
MRQINKLRSFFLRVGEVGLGAIPFNGLAKQKASDQDKFAKT